MQPPRANDHVDRFVLELLRTGLMLCELVSDLIESLPADAYPGEKPSGVVIEMLCGTIATALGSADPRDVRPAPELIDQAGARTAAHLQLACELSRRIHGEEGDAGRETANVIRRQALAGAISPDQAAQAHADLMDLRIDLWPYELLAARSWQLRHNLSIYDAGYVALAEFLQIPLITLDRRLAGAVGASCAVKTPPR